MHDTVAGLLERIRTQLAVDNAATLTIPAAMDTRALTVALREAGFLFELSPATDPNVLALRVRRRWRRDSR